MTPREVLAAALSDLTHDVLRGDPSEAADAILSHPAMVALAADAEALELLELAWGIIANAGGGDWTRETVEWQEAAVRWRDRYHAALGVAQALDEPGEAGLDVGSEYGRLLAERDRLIADGADPADLDMPLPPDTGQEDRTDG